MPKKNRSTPAKPSEEIAVGGSTYHFDSDGCYSLMNFQHSSQATVSASAVGVVKVFTKGKDALSRVFHREVGKEVGQMSSPLTLCYSNNHLFD